MINIGFVFFHMFHLVNGHVCVHLFQYASYVCTIVCPPQVIVIKKSASAKLGVSIKGGTKSTMGNPLDPNDKGIFVSKV